MINTLLLALAVATTPTAPATDSFPHATHRRLFVSCQSCHAGIVTGDSTRSRPAVTVCATCHDGQTVRTVDWAPREARPSNLHFDHRRHFAAAPDTSVAVCQRCHARADSSVFMDVARPRPERCLSCHQHQAESHLAASNQCPTCHRPLSEATRLAVATIARFPKPAWHDSAFTFGHSTAAQQATTCQVCHAREFCATCHVNAARLSPIVLLGSDPRVAQLVRGRTVSYRAPETHEAADFLRGHGLLARAGTQACANCHARESCMACHSQAPRVPIIATLPAREHGGAQGVDLSAMRPPGHSPGYRTEHRTAAAGGDASCMRCHSQTYCATCHDGAKRPEFHAVNFVTRHASDALNSANECASCHQTQAFCRDCHRQNGAAPTGSASAPGQFHNAQPGWTYGHSGAARRSLETCVSCHQQSFCMQCHSASKGWRVSPHGPGFNASMGDRNAAGCRLCHAQGPPSQ